MSYYDVRIGNITIVVINNFRHKTEVCRYLLDNFG